MQLPDLHNSALALEAAIDFHPLTVTPETSVVDAINLMSQGRSSCTLPSLSKTLDSQLQNLPKASCVLVMDGEKPIGLLTEQDFVGFAAKGMKLEGIKVADVMTQHLITLKKTDFQDIFKILNLFRQHRIRYLPILNDHGQLIGIITPNSMRQVLQPTYLLKLQQVRDVMSTEVIHAPLTASVLELAQLMAKHHVNCVVITEVQSEGLPLIPIGIVTERDILQFQALQLDLHKLQAQTIMSSPLFCLCPQDSLSIAYQEMQQRYVQRVVVTGSNGELVGILTLTGLLQALNPVELHSVIRQVSLRESVLAKVALHIRQSLNLEEILNTTVTEVRQLLEADRVIIYRFDPNSHAVVVVESVAEDLPSMLGKEIRDHCFADNWIEPYKNGRIQATADIYNAGLSQCHIELLAPFQVKANLVVPIWQDGGSLWGLLAVQQCSAPRKWQPSEIDFMEKLATQVAIAIQQATLFEQAQTELAERKRVEAALQKANEQLEIKVKERTAKLEQTNKQLQQEIAERKQVEETLRESQRFIQRIADSTPVTVYLYDLLEHKYVYTNKEIVKSLGYTPEEFQKMGSVLVQTLMHPEDFAKLPEHFQSFENAKEGNVLEREYRMKHASGEWRWLLSRDTVFSRTSEGKPKQILGRAEDITAQKQAEEALQQVNEQLNSKVKELEQRNQEMYLLSEMSDFLQACLTVEEAYSALATLIEPLFPGSAGGVFMINSSNTLVEAVTTWGTPLATQTIFTPNECWALRRGRSHWVKDTQAGLSCKHFHCNSSSSESLCVPLIAQGEALGVLYLGSIQSGKLTETKRQLALAVAEQTALALANLKLRETLQYQSVRDPLTGLYNRRYLEESLEREISRARRNQQSLGIIMLDVDHFKRFNDTFGHEAGDVVLRELGMFLQGNVRKSDIACRYGGEELVLILPEASLENTAARAEQIREDVKHLNLQDRGQSLGAITVSLGVACFPKHGQTGEAVIWAADAALYLAKSEGRDRVVTAEFGEG